MEPTLVSYDWCRRYIHDRKATLNEQTYGTLLGAIRGRNLRLLCDASKLVDWTISSVETVITLRQVEAFFKKNATFSDEEVCLEAAKLSFHESEKVCKLANKRLDWYYRHPNRINKRYPGVEGIISRAMDWISKVLGDYSDFMGEIPQRVLLTSGATSTHGRASSQPHMKVRLRQTCTSGAQPWLHALARSYGYKGLRTKVVNWNRVETVPKNWKTHRTIACEPAGNIPLQLAFDGYIKDRLRCHGIDLGDQSRNQEFARIGSLCGKYATLDLKSASDRLAQNTVAWLIPSDWYKGLSSVRSSHYRGAFGTGKYHKFSSMGNGTTFVLETLVFAALCVGSGARDFCVYGDDIAITAEHVPALQLALRFFGFSLNVDKTFTDGPFRESCGKDYWLGRLITPFYVRDASPKATTLVHNINGLVAVSEPYGLLWEALRECADALPKGPLTYSTSSNVWIDTHTCYAKKLIRHGRKGHMHMPQIKAYVSKSQSKLVCDSRTLFIWHLRANGRDLRLTDTSWDRHLNERRETANECSRVPSLSHKYVRKWVCWIPPAMVTPLYLYWWSDFLARETR